MLSEIRLRAPSASKRMCRRIQPGKKVKESACVAAMARAPVAPLADGSGLAADALQAAQQILGQGPEMNAGRRQARTLGAPHEERRADPVLQGTDAPAESRLRHVSHLRRAGEIPLLRQCEKILEPVQVHTDADDA